MALRAGKASISVLIGDVLPSDATVPLYLADISVPPLVWARLGLTHPLAAFGTDTIARIGVTPASDGR
jgi:hypothetical protein